ncbi:MAG TPA: SDR family oxidoreductase [Mycobacteriales bacterium]|jgi:NAD(P)-dependent dehydrogenase (short-subunit alcohol dehydrogenase family)|nr:SDR family oxidoreductase [Mycobacteriales bacterium]
MSRGTVFVTGASTGIGYATALRLAGAGFTVIPGLRRDEPLPDPVAKPVLLDLANPDSLGPACAEVLDRADGKLAGLVNNAGMNVSGVFEAMSLDEWRTQFEVNLFGHLAITQALLPALTSSRGRIVTVGSIGGRMSLPYLAPYSASKFAVRAWMDALRGELAPQGVRAILIEPGAIATPLWEKGTSSATARIDDLPPDIKARYERYMNGALHTAELAERHAIPADRCAKVIERALTARHPKGRYLVGPDARLQAMIAILPTRMFDGVASVLIRPRD